MTFWPSKHIHSAHSPTGEPIVTPRQQVRVGAVFRPARDDDPPAVELLKAVEQHRAVALVQDVAPNFDGVVRANRQEKRVEGGVVQLAERHAVSYQWCPLFAVGHDVGSIEQFLMA